MKYPTGVENHGGKLRIWFVYKGVRVRENLGVPDTAKNRRVAGELRSSVCYAIKTGVFDYAKQFPSSRNLEKFGEARQDLTIKELAEKFLALKETEVAKTSLNTYRAVIKNILSIIGEKNLASSINKEKLLEVRKELLTGYQIPKSNFVFQPEVSARVKNYGDHFTVDSIRQMWDAAIKRAGLRHRKSYQSRHTYACWSLTAGANPAFIANQMGHADAQMVFQVYGKWMSENNNAQVALLNTQLSEFAPTMPHNEAMKN
ncbi:DUF3596 domain-containing protein [Escherichia coli]|nr:DUF3596 domain-containing protein [Escherichia coli]